MPALNLDNIEHQTMRSWRTPLPDVQPHRRSPVSINSEDIILCSQENASRSRRLPLSALLCRTVHALGQPHSHLCGSSAVPTPQRPPMPFLRSIPRGPPVAPRPVVPIQGIPPRLRPGVPGPIDCAGTLGPLCGLALLRAAGNAAASGPCTTLCCHQLA